MAEPPEKKEKVCHSCGLDDQGQSTLLDADGAAAAFAALPENLWTLEEKRLTRKFTAKNFLQAVAFVNAVAPVAEDARHHPDIHITNYREVELVLFTHSQGGLTPDDLGTTWHDLMARAEAFHERTGVCLFTQPLGQDSQLPMMLIADARPPFRAGPNGELVADLTREDVRDYLAEWVRLYRAGVLPRECVTRGWVLEGFPTDVFAARKLCAKGLLPTRFLHIAVDDAECMRRHGRLSPRRASSRARSTPPRGPPR